MATNFIQNGETITWTNGTGSAVASGDIVINDLIGMALVDIAASASGAVAARGVFELPAVNDAAINQGAKVYFDATAGKITPPPRTTPWSASHGKPRSRPEPWRGSAWDNPAHAVTQ